MLQKNIGILLLGLVCTSMTFAQASKVYTTSQRQYQDALALYNDGQYQAAQALFKKVGQETEDQEVLANSVYYEANAAIRLNQIGAEGMMESFVERYTTSTKRNTAFMDVGDYYFGSGRYPYAAKWYKKVDRTSLSFNERERFDFNYGYSLFASNQKDEAKRYLGRVTTSPTYGSQAKYYLGYMAYQEDDYAMANQRFDQIVDQDELKEKMSYYQADMNFKLGNFDKAIALAKEQLAKSDVHEVSELNKIIGESYFNLGQYANAIPYLEAYEGKKGKWSNTDHYLLGYCHYKQQDYASAEQQFNKIVDGRNAVAQNAYYHLAECYLKLDKKQEALNAFRNASQMDFSADIQQDAALNYAKLSYEIGNAYEPAPKVLSDFLQKYPKHPDQELIKELLVDSYITSQNFTGAMELLEQNSSYASDDTYQRVAYYRGAELYREGDYHQALVYLDKALSKGSDQTYKAKTLYWTAMTEYQLGQYADALEGFTQMKQLPASTAVSEYGELEYQLGYTNFQLKRYREAASHFLAYSNQAGQNPTKQLDAYLRLADSQFAGSNYLPAIEAYDKVLQKGSDQQDYATYQKALGYGLLGREDIKIKELNGLLEKFPNSGYCDDTLFELGNTYLKTGEERKGLLAYQRLAQRYPKSPLVSKALLREGLAHYNAGRNEDALKLFKQVAADYPNTQEAVSAVGTAKMIYVDSGRVNEYGRWVQGLDFVEVSDAELDKATFESANKQWMAGNSQAAIRGMENYLNEFPQGLQAAEAHFYLGQLYFEAQQYSKALPHYRYSIEKGSPENREQALARTCEIYVAQDNYGEAMPYLQQLEQEANIVQNRTFAKSNLMKGFYQQQDYQKTIAYANQVLQASNVDERIANDAHIMMARAARATQNEKLARESYAKVLVSAPDQAAAEAQYFKAYFEHKDGDYETSNASVQELAKRFSGQREWAGKGLILMAQNYDVLGDAFQATYILESVIANFTDYPELTSQAQMELTRVKTKVAKENSSIDANND